METWLFQPYQLLTYELIHYYDEIECFTLSSWVVSLSIHYKIYPINKDMSCDRFLLFHTSRWRLWDVNPRKLWPWPFRLIEPFLPSSKLVHREKSTVLTVHSFLNCSTWSMFHQWLHNLSKTLLDFTLTCPNTPSKCKCGFCLTDSFLTPKCLYLIHIL